MTKYRLKDAELQKRLDEVTGGNFSHRLQDNDFVKRMEIKGRNVAVTLLLLTEEVEPIPEYTTKGWNPFPEVTPPDGVLMRLEYVDKCGAKRKTCAMVSRKMCGIVSKGVWTNFDGYEIDIDKGRFRPWEDE